MNNLFGRIKVYDRYTDLVEQIPKWVGEGYCFMTNFVPDFQKFLVRNPNGKCRFDLIIQLNKAIETTPYKIDRKDLYGLEVPGPMSIPNQRLFRQLLIEEWDRRIWQ